MTGLTPKIVQIYYEDKLCGYAFFHYDVTYDQYLRLNLSHFSLRLYDEYSSILEKFIDFLSENLLFDEIIVDIFYLLKVYNF